MLRRKKLVYAHQNVCHSNLALLEYRVICMIHGVGSVQRNDIKLGRVDKRHVSLQNVSN